MKKKRSFDAAHVPTSRLVRQSAGVANGVQGEYADALKGIPCPRSVSLQGGRYEIKGEIPAPPTSIGYQCDAYGHL